MDQKSLPLRTSSASKSEEYVVTQSSGVAPTGRPSSPTSKNAGPKTSMTLPVWSKMSWSRRSS